METIKALLIFAITLASRMVLIGIFAGVFAYAVAGEYGPSFKSLMLAAWAAGMVIWAATTK